MKSEIDLARLAMCIDCEGSVTVAKQSRPSGYNGGFAYYISISISNTDKNLIDWVESFGFTIGISKSSSKKLCYVATLSSSKASEVLKLVRPYMIVKALKADLAIAMQDTMGAPGHNLLEGVLDLRESIYKMYRRINMIV